MKSGFLLRPSTALALLTLVALVTWTACGTTAPGSGGDLDAGDNGGGADAGFDPWAGYDGGLYHPAGWADSSNPDFHGAHAIDGIGLCQYCHGADLNGGSVGIGCDSCHTGGAAWRTNCTFCHGGTDNQTGAPPRDVHGKTATTEPTVGHHTTHVEGGAFANAFDCTECHVKPTDVLSAGHIDGEITLTFGALAKTGGANPSFSTGANSCASAYCHGAFTGGNTANAPVWTGTNQAACGSCHSLPPSTGKHWHYPSRAGCEDCHPDATNTSITDKAKHVNGVKDVGGAGTRINSWSGGYCTPQCHGTKHW